MASRPQPQFLRTSWDGEWCRCSLSNNCPYLFLITQKLHHSMLFEMRWTERFITSSLSIKHASFYHSFFQWQAWKLMTVQMAVTPFSSFDSSTVSLCWWRVNSFNQVAFAHCEDCDGFQFDTIQRDENRLTLVHNHFGSCLTCLVVATGSCQTEQRPVSRAPGLMSAQR